MMSGTRLGRSPRVLRSGAGDSEGERALLRAEETIASAQISEIQIALGSGPEPDPAYLMAAQTSHNVCLRLVTVRRAIGKA